MRDPYEASPYETTAQYQAPASYADLPEDLDSSPTGRNGGNSRNSRDGGNGRNAGDGRRKRFRRTRRFFRRPTVRVVCGAFALLLIWVTFSMGQALASPGQGSISSKLAEWARDHHLGPLVTFGEWLSYNPPPVGGKPSFSLQTGVGNLHFKHHKHGFQPIVPKKLASPAGKPLPGEGEWRLLESVKGQPAMFSTFLRPDSQHTSFVAGIVSLDQRLLKFQLHPGSEDPGPGNWKSPPDIPQGSRRGLMATFNGGFKLDSAEGGFYLNGITKGNLTKGAATLVYYKNGKVKVGVWGRDVTMTPQVAGVRQNLKLIVDHGKVPANVNNNVLTNWGATLGGGYYVWRSGVGVTKDGRLIYVYGPALNVASLAGLLQRAGAVEAMQMDINPFWMSFEYYKSHGHPTDPTPTNLLPTQQQSAYRYYSVYTRDFTAVYAR